MYDLWGQATCVQAILVLRFRQHSLCACLDIFPDICADNLHPTLWVAFSLHTSPLLSRHLRGQTLIHALSDILHAHMSGLYVTDSSLPLRMTEKAFRMTKQGQHQDDKMGDIRKTRPFLNHRSFTPPMASFRMTRPRFCAHMPVFHQT